MRDIAMIGRHVLGLEKIDKTQVRSLAARPRTLGSFRGSKAFASRLAFA
jgi:hypothetical protein